MAKNVWCVAPATRTIDLEYVDADGDRHPFWIKVKERLTVGEEKRVRTAGFGAMRTNTEAEREVKVNWDTMAFARMEVYVTDWSLEIDSEKHVKLPLDRGAIESLNPDVFALIEDAITKHLEEMDAAKKLQAGRSGPALKSA